MGLPKTNIGKVARKDLKVEVISPFLIDERVNPAMIRLKASQTIDPEYMKDRSLNMDEGVVGFVATHKRPLIVENVLDEPKFKEKEMAKKLGLVSMVRNVDELTSPSRRTDLGRICLISDHKS